MGWCGQPWFRCTHVKFLGLCTCAFEFVFVFCYIFFFCHCVYESMHRVVPCFGRYYCCSFRGAFSFLVVHIQCVLVCTYRNSRNFRAKNYSCIFVLKNFCGLRKTYSLSITYYVTRRNLPNLGSNSWSSLPGSYPLTIRLLGSILD